MRRNPQGRGDFFRAIKSHRCSLPFRIIRRNSNIRRGRVARREFHFNFRETRIKTAREHVHTRTHTRKYIVQQSAEEEEEEEEFKGLVGFETCLLYGSRLEIFIGCQDFSRGTSVISRSFFLRNAACLRRWKRANRPEIREGESFVAF